MRGSLGEAGGGANERGLGVWTDLALNPGSLCYLMRHWKELHSILGRGQTLGAVRYWSKCLSCFFLDLTPSLKLPFSLLLAVGLE